MIALALTLAALATTGPEDGPLTLSDLADYPAALASRSNPAAKAVGFRELWDHLESYRGRRVRVEGEVVRRFGQGPQGQLPALTELWIVAGRGDPICLVFPTSKGEPGPSDRVRFEGTFLKRLRYHGGDVDRLAPLIVGGQAPEVISPGASAQGAGRAWLDWLVGGVAAAVVGLVLASRHLQRPEARREPPGPTPTFMDAAKIQVGRDDLD